MSASLCRITLAAHVISAIYRAQREGRRVDLDTLTESIGVRRADIRATLSDLHREGLVDVLRTRLTLEGFRVGALFHDKKLRALRVDPRTGALVAA